MLNKYYRILPYSLTAIMAFSASIMCTFAINGHPDIFSGNFETNCMGANVVVYEYFDTNTTKMQRIFDEFWWSELAYIRDNSQIYTWDGNGGSLGLDCKDPVNWIFPSNVTPGNNIHVTALENDRKCTLTRNNDPTKPFGQFNFRLSYATSLGILQPVSIGNYAYWQENGTPGVSIKISDQSKRNWTPSRTSAPQFHANECLTLYARWCGDGIVSNAEQCDLGTQNGQAGSACSATCQTVTSLNPYSACVVGNPTADCATNTYVDQATCLAANPGTSGRTCYLNNIPSCNTTRAVQCPVLPACVPGTLSGPQPSPVIATSAGLCPTGQAVGGFTSNTVGAEARYSWSCGGSAVGGACTATYNSLTSGNFDLRIKKYAKGEDVFASIEKNEDFNYNIIAENAGPEKVSGLTTIKDVLPRDITLRAQPSGNGWDCSTSDAAGGKNITCTTSDPVNAHQTFNVITVPVRATDATFQANGIINVALIQNPNEPIGRRCFSDNHMPIGNESQCTEDPLNADPASVNPPNPNGYDLRLKKYVNGDDESSVVNADGTIDYTFAVQNLGELPSVGTITVSDTDFPTGITISTITALQGEWTCARNSATSFTCVTSRVLVKGEYTSTITLKAIAASTLAVGTYKNVACLDNAGDPNNNALFDPAHGYYKVNNCDPAEVVVVPPGSFDLSLKKYVAEMVNGVAQRDGDHQTSNDGADLDRDILVVPRGGKLRYRFAIRNLGPVTATGMTTLEDTLPNDTLITSVVGTGWNCLYGATLTQNNGGRSFICTRSDDLSIGATYPEVTLLADSATTILAGEYSNIATIRNPGDTNPANNTDPANIKITVGPTCGSIIATPSISPQPPNTAITYTCASLGFTGVATNLEYNIKCGAADVGTWSGVATRVCNLPATNDTIQNTTCAVRDKTIPTVIFSGSETNACRNSISTTSGGGGGSTYFVPECANGIRSCSTQVHTSYAACSLINGGKTCYYSNTECNAANSLVCSGNGGPVCIGPSCVTYTGGRCGDGILQVGEECDVINASWCVACKVDLTTNPGANPITDIYLSIPGLSQRIGSSPIIEKTFSENSMVLGVNTKAFTIADTVSLVIKTRYQIPLMLEANKQMCLKSSGNSVNDAQSCATVGANGNVQNVNGANYVILGDGSYQVRQPDNSYIRVDIANPLKKLDLFKGSTQYRTQAGNSGPTLNSTFFGRSIGDDGKIALMSQSVNDPTLFIDLASFRIRVSGAMMGSTSSTVNRSIAQYIGKNDDTFTAFLSGFKRTTTTTSTTTTASNNASSAVSHISIGGVIINNASVSTVSELISDYKLNGNENIFSVKGNLTLCPQKASPDTLTLYGVRTLVVEGNLTINCNMSYSDAVASWAFIVKGGNIIIDTSVTNLAGVFVAIPGSVTTAGKFVSANGTTSNILRLDGSMYGDAQPLLDTRLYVRGTSAYDILTTGVILSYSNRALVSPPPLLSEYLNNYNVTRVAK